MGLLWYLDHSRACLAFVYNDLLHRCFVITLYINRFAWVGFMLFCCLGFGDFVGLLVVALVWVGVLIWLFRLLLIYGSDCL